MNNFPSIFIIFKVVVYLIFHGKDAEATKFTREMMNNFTLEVCYNYSRNFFEKASCEHRGNLVVSPLSSIPIAMAAYGAEGNEALISQWMLHLPKDVSVARREYKNIIKKFQIYDDVYLEFASKMFVSKNLTLQPKFEDVNRYIFHSEILKIDTSNPKSSEKAINCWISKNMNNMINAINDTSTFDSGDEMFLFNAVYFKGKWKHKFNEELTVEKSFYVNKISRILVPTMSATGKFIYGDLPFINASFIVLPYKDENVRMIIVRPNEINGLKQIERNLNYLFSFTNLAELGHKRNVHVQLPKFVIENTVNLKHTIERTEKLKFFIHTNLTGIAHKPVQINHIATKIVIEVDEDGGRIDDLSYLGFEFMYEDAYVDFTVDRPSLFLLAVGDKYILIGRLTDPPQSKNYKTFLNTNKSEMPSTCN